MALTIEQVADITTEFCRRYPSAFALKFKIRNTQEELYGPQASHVPAISAGYHPHRRIVAIAASHLRDDRELRRTLRHEIIGHYGLNTFAADEKRKILEAIGRSREEPSLRPLWREVDRGYPAASPLLKAEEVFAFAAERIRPGQRYDLAPGLTALKTVLSDDQSVVSLRRLLALTTLVAQGLEQGTRLQRNFPQSDDALFSAERTKSKRRALGTDGAHAETPRSQTLESYHEQVAAKLIDQLKQGIAPWQRPLMPGSANNFFPYNPTSGANYRGMNMITLMAGNRADPRWMTYRQAETIGAQVRKGEKGTPIQFWSFTRNRDLLDEDGKPVLDERGRNKEETVRLARPLVRFATVFNAEQIDGLREREGRPPPTNTIERANEVLGATGAVIRHDQVERMFYRLATDTIHLPEPGQFRSAGDYYATAFHEVGHWSGHPTRLARDLSHPFGSEGYAKEELRAEIASLMISQELNLPHDPENHASYVGSWIKVLEDDPREIFRAASEAEKIRGFVMGMTLKHEQTLEEGAELKATRKEAREYLSVPYGEKEDAKQLGAKWDRAAKAWFVPGGIDPGAFTRWAPMAASVSAAKDAIGEFAQPTDTLGATNREPLNLSLAHNDSPDVSSLQRIAGSAAMVRALALGAAESPLLSQQLAESDLEAYQGLPADSVERTQARALIGESAALDGHYGATLRVLNAAATRAAELLSLNRPDTEVEQLSQNSAAKTRDEPTRSYLLVPYEERSLARAAGARWDANAKSWYAGPNADHERLAKWARVGSRPIESAVSAQQEFAARLIDGGARVTGEHPIMDGATHRIAVAGDKHHERSGFYVGHVDDIRPAGYFKNNRTGEEFRWKAKGYTLTESQKAAFVAAASTKLQERERARLERQEQRADQLAAQLPTLRSLTPETRTPYLVAKNLPSFAGVYTDKEADTLVVPLMDAHGKQWSQQYIRSDGTKRLASEARKEGCFHVVDGFERLKQAKVFVLAEGYATAAAIHESHNARVAVAVVAAVDAGNLTAVAKALRTEFPTTPIVIAGEDDRLLQRRQKKNPGRNGALAAADAVDGVAVFPTFDPKDNLKLTDFDDLRAASALGVEGLRRQLVPVIEKAGGLEEEEEVTQVRTLAIRRRGPGQEEGPRRIKRSIG